MAFSEHFMALKRLGELGEELYEYVKHGNLPGAFINCMCDNETICENK